MLYALTLKFSRDIKCGSRQRSPRLEEVSPWGTAELHMRSVVKTIMASSIWVKSTWFSYNHCTSSRHINGVGEELSMMMVRTAMMTPGLFESRYSLQFWNSGEDSLHSHFREEVDSVAYLELIEVSEFDQIDSDLLMEIWGDQHDDNDEDICTSNGGRHWNMLITYIETSVRSWYILLEPTESLEFPTFNFLGRS
jgi:hypothetical protein